MIPEIIFEFPEVPQINFLIDLRGESLYQKWLQLGLGTGDYTAFLEWLKVKGDKGASAYDVAVELGFGGTQAEWVASLKGEKGDKGDAGTTLHANLTDKNSEASVQHVDTTVTKNTLAENDKVALYDSESGKVVLSNALNDIETILASI